MEIGNKIKSVDSGSSKKEYYLKPKLTDSDRAILHGISAIMPALDEFFGSECEVVLHTYNDATDDISIIKIINGHVTGRKKGGPLITQNMEVFSNETIQNTDIIDSYYTRTHDGKIIKSVSSLVRNSENEPIGILCINVNLSAPLISWLHKLTPQVSSPSQNGSNSNQPQEFEFSKRGEKKVELSDSKVDITSQINKIIADSTNSANIRSSNIKKDIISDLHDEGIFDLKGAIDVVAEKIGLSRFTVYHYLREIRNAAE